MIVLMSLRNLVRNRKNSVIVLLLITVITWLFFIGTTVISQSRQRLKSTYSANITGDIVIEKKSDISMSIFGANTPVIQDFFTIPELAFYNKIFELLKTDDSVAGISSMVSGSAITRILGKRAKTTVFGVDSGTYFKMFPGIKLVEGKFLTPGERGVMITADRRVDLEKRTKKKLIAGATVRFTVASGSGFKIREVPLVGVFKYTNPGQGMNDIVLADPQTVRGLNSILVASNSGFKPPEEAVDLLGSDEESLFGDSSGSGVQNVSESSGISADNVRQEIGKVTEGSSSGWTGGDWNFILARTKDGVSVSKVIDRLNKEIEKYGAKAVDWKTAAGTSALLVQLVGLLFNSGFLLVAAAGIIGIVSIMLIAVFKRTREIGTLRALGASDGYIRTLILLENLFLSAAAGVLAVIAGFFFLEWINTMGITVDNQFVAGLLGGRVINISFYVPAALESLGSAAVLGLAASLYPVRKALKIEPIVAVREG